MASTKTSPSKMSKGKVNKTRHMDKGKPDAQPSPSRAHRADTPEARQQRKNLPKTHAKSRAPSAGRKDA